MLKVALLSLETWAWALTDLNEVMLRRTCRRRCLARKMLLSMNCECVRRRGRELGVRNPREW